MQEQEKCECLDGGHNDGSGERCLCGGLLDPPREALDEGIPIDIETANYLIRKGVIRGP